MLLEDVSGPGPAEEKMPPEIPKEEAPPTSDVDDDVDGEEKSVEDHIKAAGGEVEEEEPPKKEGKEEEPKEEVKEKEPAPKTKKSAEDRIGEITKKFRTEERKRLAVEEKLKAIEEKLKGVADEHTKEKQQKIDNEIDALWKLYGDAVSEGDGEEAVKIHKKIDELKSKKASPPQKKEKKEASDEEIDERVIEKEAERAVDRFKKRNPWFNENEDMREFAIYTEKRLNKKGFDGTYEELLDEVETEVKARFTTKRSGLPSVAGVGATKRMTSESTYELNEEEKKVAHGVYPGIPRKEAEKKYIDDLKKFGRSK